MIHQHYDQLTIVERNAVDEGYRKLAAAMKEYGIGIRGDDTAEHVVDAIAKGVIESRGLLKRPNPPAVVPSTPAPGIFQ